MFTVICAGRDPCSSDCEVGFDDTDKISALGMKIHADAGQGDLGSAFSSIIAGKNMEEEIFCSRMLMCR